MFYIEYYAKDVTLSYLLRTYIMEIALQNILYDIYNLERISGG